MIGVFQSAMVGLSQKLGPELVINGDFSDGKTGWAAGFNNPTDEEWYVENGWMVIARNGKAIQQGITTEINKKYRVQALAKSNGVSIAQVYISKSPNLIGQYIHLPLPPPSAGTTPIILHLAFTAVATTTYVWLYCGNISGNISYFDNVSVKEAYP